MENKAHALAAGLFVLLVTAMLVALAAWLTRDATVRNTYVLSSPDGVTGLQPQAAVRYKGVLVGKVTQIGFDPQTPGNVMVKIAVDPAAPITTATYATLGFQGVTGLAYVALGDKGPSKKPLVAQDGLEPRIPLRQGLMGRLEEQGGRVLDQVELAANRLNQLLAPENQQALVASLQQAGQAAQSVQQLAASLNHQVDPKRLNLPDLAQQANSTLQSLQATSDQTRSTVQTLSDKVAASGGPLEQWSDSARQLNRQTLPAISRMTEDTGRAFRQWGRLMGDLKENPQSLLYGNGPITPGPGEPGFVAPAAATAPPSTAAMAPAMALDAAAAQP